MTAFKNGNVGWSEDVSLSLFGSKSNITRNPWRRQQMKGFGNPSGRGRCINTNSTRGCQPRSLTIAVMAATAPKAAKTAIMAAAIVAMGSDYPVGKDCDCLPVIPLTNCGGAWIYKPARVGSRQAAWGATSMYAAALSKLASCDMRRKCRGLHQQMQLMQVRYLPSLGSSAKGGQKSGVCDTLPTLHRLKIVK